MTRSAVATRARAWIARIPGAMAVAFATLATTSCNGALGAPLHPGPAGAAGTALTLSGALHGDFLAPHPVLGGCGVFHLADAAPDPSSDPNPPSEAAAQYVADGTVAGHRARITIQVDPFLGAGKYATTAPVDPRRPPPPHGRLAFATLELDQEGTWRSLPGLGWIAFDAGGGGRIAAELDRGQAGQAAGIHLEGRFSCAG